MSRLLYVDVKWPTPGSDAASQRTLQLAGELAGLGFDIDFASMYGTDAYPRAAAEAAVVLPALGRGRALDAAGEEQMIEHARAHARDYDVAVLAWTRVASRLIPVLRDGNPGLRIVFDTNDVNHVREFRHARVSGNANVMRRALAMKQAELAAVAAADLTLAISEHDAEVLRAGVPAARVEVVTLGAPERTDEPPGPEGRTGALFLGNYEAYPNLDAAGHFIDDVLPLLRAERPDFSVTIAGAGRGELIEHLAGPGVVRAGYVPDLPTMLDGHRLFVCPLRIGSGVKGKLLTALAYGLPAVATPIAAEGMELRDGAECLIAESAADFAAACARLDVDVALWRSLQRNGRRTASERFGAQAIRRQVASVFAPLLADGTLAVR